MARRTKAQIEADEARESESVETSEQNKNTESKSAEKAEEDSKPKEATEEEKETTPKRRRRRASSEAEDNKGGDERVEKNSAQGLLTEEEIRKANSTAVVSESEEISDGVVQNSETSRNIEEVERPYKDLSDREVDKRLAVAQRSLQLSQRSSLAMRSQYDLSGSKTRRRNNPSPVDVYNDLMAEKSYRS